MNTKVMPSVFVILGGGVVMLLGSFLDFYSFGSAGHSAWSGDLYFPVTIIPVILGVVMAAHVALTSFANVDLPERVLGLTWNQIHLAAGFQAVVMMVAFLIVDNGTLDFGIGLWLMLLASIALIVGAVLREREAAPAA